MNTLHRSLITVHLLLASAVLLFAQGSLAPPSQPTPSMKTLEQIEPRTNLQASMLPPGVTTDDDNHFIIGAAGSYYLSSNLEVTKTNGILINIAGVTLDLNGFEISRTSGSGGDGITIASTAHRTAIQNGSIKGFAYGIHSPGGAELARGCHLRYLSVSHCSTRGIVAGFGAVLESCRAHDNDGGGMIASYGSSMINCTANNNTGVYGISVEQGSALVNCAAYNNTTTFAIRALGGSSLSNCTAYSNTAAYGIYASDGSSLTNCSARQNSSGENTSAGIGTGTGVTLTNCSSSENTTTLAPGGDRAMGFELGDRSRLQNSSASQNEGDGIVARAHGLIKDNLVTGNRFGIRVTGNRTVIDGNSITEHITGIVLHGCGALVIKNRIGEGTAIGSSGCINPDNQVGPTVLLTNAGDLTTQPNANHPWANFVY